MMLGIGGLDSSTVKHTGGIVSARRLMRRSGIAGYGVGTIGVSQNHNEVTHSGNIEEAGKLSDMAARTAQEIVTQSEILDGISSEGQLAGEEDLSTLAIRAGGQFQKALAIAPKVTHNRVSLGHSQAKTGHTE
jgi:hypothetical protein